MYEVQMKKILIFPILLIVATILSSETLPEPESQSQNTTWNLWGYFDYGNGILKNVFLRSLEGGVGMELNDKYRFTVYKKIYSEPVEMFDDAKYEFLGYGVQFGRVWQVNNWKFCPSIGIEKGRMRTGQGSYTLNWLGYDYEYFTYDDIYYTILSLSAQYRLGSVVALNGKLFAAINPDYPAFGLSLGLNLGKMK